MTPEVHCADKMVRVSAARTAKRQMTLSQSALQAAESQQPRGGSQSATECKVLLHSAQPRLVFAATRQQQQTC